MRTTLMWGIVMFFAGVPAALAQQALAQEANLTEKQESQLIKRFPKSDANKDGKLDDAELRAMRDFQARRNNAPVTQPSSGKSQADADTDQWNTIGLRQANTMGGGAAAIPESGKFRVFVLMGQSNMTGAARAAELTSPYTEKHDRIRIWANGQWEYFVPRVRFGPGVSMAHELAELWPADTIGIIKVSDGGTGVRAFEKNWTKERAARAFDGDKGSMYQDLMNAVAAARKFSQPEFSGFVWKQGAADGTKKDLADEYYDTFKTLVSDLRTDLGNSDLPVFMLSNMSDQELLQAVLATMTDEDVRKAKESASKPPITDGDMLGVLVSYMSDLPKEKQSSRKNPYIATVIMAQNRAGREIPNVVTVHHGKLPVEQDGIHFNAEGQIQLGKITASAIGEFYKETVKRETKNPS